MPVARLTRTLPARVVHHTVGLWGRARRRPADVATEDSGDSSATRELLRPTSQDEAPAARASRQARLYLERRRRQLNEQLRTGR